MLGTSSGDAHVHVIIQNDGFDTLLLEKAFREYAEDLAWGFNSDSHMPTPERSVVSLSSRGLLHAILVNVLSPMDILIAPSLLGTKRACSLLIVTCFCIHYPLQDIPVPSISFPSFLVVFFSMILVHPSSCFCYEKYYHIQQTITFSKWTLHTRRRQSHIQF